jgi:cyclopropane fatty-acyl-phospholipid synthase-like methyltransferase
VRSASLRRAAPFLPLGGRAGIIVTEIFPGGRLPSVPMVEEKATDAGFNPTKLQEIGPHYVKTLKIWADALEAHREEAIAIQGQTVYDRHDKYLNGCQRYFREGYTHRASVHAAEVIRRRVSDWGSAVRRMGREWNAPVSAH